MVHANTSILGLLEAGLDPNIDHDRFPKIVLSGDDGSGFTLAFGLRDNLFGPGEPEPRKVSRAVELLVGGNERSSCGSSSCRAPELLSAGESMGRTLLRGLAAPSSSWSQRRTLSAAVALVDMPAIV